MADVRPFRAIRYDTRHSSDVSSCIAPPYDVLAEADKQRLLSANPDNIVAADLPHCPPKSAGPPELYRRAASLLRTWLAQSVLVRDATPAIYPYRQRFQHAGRQFARRGFIARVRAEAFGTSATGVFPHEQTFSGPKADRLALTRAARCQLSPIFGLFPDESGEITDSLYRSLPDQPATYARLDGVVHELWRTDQPDRIEALTAAMRDRPIFIADGHHRYTTALNYLAELEAGGPVPGDHPARFVMFVCVSLHDPGLLILPTHRVVTVRPVDAAALAERLTEAFEVTRGDLSCEQLEQEVTTRGPGWFGLKLADAGEGLLLRLAQPDILDRFEPARGQAYRRLDVAILHRYLIDEVLTPLGGAPSGIEYPHSGVEAARALGSWQIDGATSFGAAGAGPAGAGPLTKVALLVAPTPLASVRQVCLSGELMPQKSTFFFPKVATGLTLHDLSG